MVEKIGSGGWRLSHGSGQMAAVTWGGRRDVGGVDLMVHTAADGAFTETISAGA